MRSTASITGIEKKVGGGGVLCAAALLVLVTTATGCVVNEPETPARGVVVSGPPPAPVHEDRGAAPTAQAVWIGGYWHWTGIQYAWIPGHWDAPPPGATWSAPVYTARDGKYFYESGGWKPGPDAANRSALR